MLSSAITLHPPPPCGIHSSLVCSNITPEQGCHPPGFLIAFPLIPTLTSAQEKAFSLQATCKLIEKRMNAHWQKEILTATDLFCGMQRTMMNALKLGGGFYASYKVWRECSTWRASGVDLTDSCHSLDELAHVLAERLAAGPLALAVSVERVGSRVFLVGWAKKDKKINSLKRLCHTKLWCKR